MNSSPTDRFGQMGENAMPTEHEAPGARVVVVGHVAPDMVNPADGDAENPVTSRGASPVFVNVSVCAALVAPTSTSPKSSAAGEKVTDGASPTPVVSTVARTSPVSRSEKTTVPVCVPPAVGRNRTSRRHVVASQP